MGISFVRFLYYYVDLQGTPSKLIIQFIFPDEAVRADTMGSIAATAQVLANAGGIYEIVS